MSTTLNSVSGFNMAPSPSFFKPWERPDYRDWGTFTVKVDGKSLSDKEYFEKYISRLLNGNDQEPPEAAQYAKGIYDQFIQKAIGGGSLPSHASAYLSRSREINEQGGYKGKMGTELEEAEIVTLKNRLGVGGTVTDDGALEIGVRPDDESSIITTEDQVIIGGIALDISKAQRMNFMTFWYA
ncbi:MAG: hypothetical protein AB2L14_37100 [Candidatus Xenobiia bacterium LiM19]